MRHKSKIGRTEHRESRTNLECKKYLQSASQQCVHEVQGIQIVFKSYKKFVQWILLQKLPLSWEKSPSDHYTGC